MPALGCVGCRSHAPSPYHAPSSWPLSVPQLMTQMPHLSCFQQGCAPREGISCSFHCCARSSSRLTGSAGLLSAVYAQRRCSPAASCIPISSCTSATSSRLRIENSTSGLLSTAARDGLAKRL